MQANITECFGFRSSSASAAEEGTTATTTTGAATTDVTTGATTTTCVTMLVCCRLCLLEWLDESPALECKLIRALASSGCHELPCGDCEKLADNLWGSCVIRITRNVILLALRCSLAGSIDWMDDHPTSWFVVLLKVQKKVVIWLFIAPSPQGKWFAPEDEIKRSFTWCALCCMSSNWSVAVILVGFRNSARKTLPFFFPELTRRDGALSVLYL
jgi:hypothetical protein